MARSPRNAACAVFGAGALLLAGCADNMPAPTPTPSPVPTTSVCAAGSPVAGMPTLVATRLAGVFHQPLDLQSVSGDRERLYVVEQGGRIRVLRNGAPQTAPFLDISDRISTGGERGLLGLAFHPQFASNGRLFVNYTDLKGDTRIAEFHASSPDQADPASERRLLFVHQPFANHNGGGLAFGGDGKLYIGLGDGGSGGDPQGNAQQIANLLGKLLRIDVDAGAPYAIPPDNPFAGTADARHEIWAYGLRNPFRFAFDRATDDLYIGDVGQNRLEEVDFARAPRKGGENYGWNIMEGSQCYKPPTGCNRTGLTLPIYDYTHLDGCAITAGVVYRGCRMPALAGSFFFGDYCSGFVRSLTVVDGVLGPVITWPRLAGIKNVSSFGVDAEGEIYVVDYGGALFKLEPRS
jgi:glucose/arabinose dehydrogenase